MTELTIRPEYPLPAAIVESAGPVWSIHATDAGAVSFLYYIDYVAGGLEFSSSHGQVYVNVLPLEVSNIDIGVPLGKTSTITWGDLMGQAVFPTEQGRTLDISALPAGVTETTTDGERTFSYTALVPGDVASFTFRAVDALDPSNVVYSEPATVTFTVLSGGPLPEPPAFDPLPEPPAPDPLPEPPALPPAPPPAETPTPFPVVAG